MMKSEIGGNSLAKFRIIVEYWLQCWRYVGSYLPDSFNKKWVTFWKNLGYSLPSSGYLVRRMLTHIDWSRVDAIVELGGGSGVMTRAIQAYKPETSFLTTCEIDADIYQKLEQYRDTTTHIVLSDAETCLDTFGSGEVDTIISTLPLGSIEPEHTREILRAIHRTLSPDGIYLQYQYFATNKHDIEELFIIETVDWEPLNFPPAFIYVCKKK